MFSISSNNKFAIARAYKVLNIISRVSPMFYLLSSTVLATLLTMRAVQAQGLSGSAAAFAPINLAQAAPPPQFIPTDVTPFTTAPERNTFSPGYKFRLFQALPERLWFNLTAEASQRLDTMCFLLIASLKQITLFVFCQI